MVTFIVLGATGDLTKRKLIPAIYNLVEKKRIKDFAFVGAARRPINIKQLLGEAKKFSKATKNSVWKEIEKRSSYVQLDFGRKEDYHNLAEVVKELEKKFSLPGRRIFYLATLPDQFQMITDNLRKSRICARRGAWPRLVFEKPFGHDLKSAKKINKCVRSLFSEKQIYRIDHYLGKELVANIGLTRFTNRVLEPLWNREHIDSVQIILSETLGMEGRGGYYDKYGAMKDMVQNHMLQLASLIAMEAPEKLEGEFVRDKKVAVFRKIKLKDVLLGQYNGYNKEPGVRPNSRTETFAVAHLEIDTPRWRGVPFYLKTGKFLKKAEASIYVKFRMVDCLLTKTCPSDTNYFVIKLKPDEGMSLEINSKVPGQIAVTPITLDFHQAGMFGPNTPEAYETLIQEVINGNQYVFVRNDAIEYAWKAVDSVLNNKLKIYKYEKHSHGPKQLEKWNVEHKMRWRA